MSVPFTAPSAPRSAIEIDRADVRSDIAFAQRRLEELALQFVTPYKVIEEISLLIHLFILERRHRKLTTV